MNENGAERIMGIDRWEEALTWYRTLHDAEKKDLSDAVGREWQHWYADAENRRLFDGVSRLLGDRDLYGRRRRLTKAEVEGDQYDLSVPIAEWRKTQAPHKIRKEPFRGKAWWWSLSAGVGLAAIAACFALWPLWLRLVGSPPSPVIYQTGIGGLKNVRLSDGSSVILGGHTKVAVAFSPRRRSVSLVEGQAWFKVAHDRHWPFIVAAGDGTITDVGTAFLVTRESDRVVVTVTEGAVEVSAKPTTWPPFGLDRGRTPRTILAAIRITSGEELSFADNGALEHVKPTDTHAATAWTHGRLTFDDQPLRYVIETVDRYSSRHIAVSPSAGALMFSGIVHSDGIEDWLHSLEVIFPVVVQEQGPNVSIETLHSKAATHEPSQQTRP